MVNKGLIHRGIRYFWEIFWNLIKSYNELVIKIRENARFKKITQRWIHGIKNHSIWISIRGEIKEQSGEKFPKIRRSKTKIKNEIKLNYNPKLQIDDTWRKISGKTLILTWDSDQNDPISHQIEAFHSGILKTSIGVQETNSP